MIAPKPNKGDVRICVDIGVPTKSMLLIDEIIVVGGLVKRGMRIVVPLTLRERVLQLVPEGCQGIVQTKDRRRRNVWGLMMNAMVERHCKKCPFARR